MLLGNGRSCVITVLVCV